MSASEQRKTVFNWDDFERTTSALKSFKSKLPEDSVRSLAKEVIERVSQRGNIDRVGSVHRPSGDQIEHLAFALIDADIAASREYISVIRDKGATTEEVYLAYLAGAARRLGQWWTENHISFMDVTLATSRIYGLLNALKTDDSRIVPSLTPSAVFMTVPGETHNLGVQMAADLFRRQGWSIDLVTDKAHDEVIATAESLQPAVVGISAAGEHSMIALAKLMVALRVHCPDTLIVVSGALLTEAEDLVAELSPDAMVSDVTAAYNIFSDLWEIVERRHAVRHESYP